MAVREPARVLVVSSLLCAAVLVATCPCEVLGACKQRQFYAATVLPLVAVAYLNATGTA